MARTIRVADCGRQGHDHGVPGMLISTMNDIPGYEITEVLGEVFGLTVRSRNAGSQLGSAFKSLAGGELKGMTKNPRSAAARRLPNWIRG